MIGRLSLSDKSIIFLIIHNLLHRVIVKKKMCLKMCSTNIIKKNKGKQNYKVDLKGVEILANSIGSFFFFINVIEHSFIYKNTSFFFG